MRETRLIASNELAIRLEGNKPSYAPGDSIVGYIVRGAPLVTPQAWITVTVGGRVKSRVAGKSYSGPSGRWEVISEQTHFQKIHEGPLHVDASLPGHERERAWPFSIHIPWYIDYGLTAGRATQPTQPGLTDVEDAAHQLPDSMLEKDYAGMGTDPFAEYWVKAELRSAEQASVDRCVAIYPFTLRKTTRKPPISSESRPTHRYAAAASICSDRLVHDPSANLSFFQKIFGSQQTPIFAGQMEFEIPAVIQLEHPDPIPLCLRFVVDRRKTSPGVLNAAAWPKISLLRLVLEIEARTVTGDEISSTASTSGTLDLTWKGDEHMINVPLRVWSASSDMQEPLHIPICGGHGTNETTPPVDVGRLLGIHVRRTGIVGSMFTPAALIPSCATIAFRHSHHVKVILDAEVGGKQIQCRFRRDMTILAPGEVDHSGRDGVWRPPQDEEMQPPPVVVRRSGDMRPPATDRAYEDEFPPPIYGWSDSWIRPPAFEPPPPTFAEVEREDLLRRGRIQTV